jgi:hypothetical protein
MTGQRRSLIVALDVEVGAAVATSPPRRWSESRRKHALAACGCAVGQPRRCRAGAGPRHGGLPGRDPAVARALANTGRRPPECVHSSSATVCAKAIDEGHEICTASLGPDDWTSSAERVEGRRQRLTGGLAGLAKQRKVTVVMAQAVRVGEPGGGATRARRRSSA